MVHGIPLSVDVGKLDKLKKKQIILQVVISFFFSGVKP